MIYSTRRFVLCLTLCYFVLVFLIVALPGLFSYHFLCIPLFRVASGPTMKLAGVIIVINLIFMLSL